MLLDVITRCKILYRRCLAFMTPLFLRATLPCSRALLSIAPWPTDTHTPDTSPTGSFLTPTFSPRTFQPSKAPPELQQPHKTPLPATQTSPRRFFANLFPAEGAMQAQV